MFINYFVKKFTKKVVGEFNGGEDPFVEEYELERRSFLSGSSKIVKKKRPKTIPEYIPESQQIMIRALRRRCYRMELIFTFWGMKFGWLNVMKIVPVVGDICALCFSLLVLRDTRNAMGGMPSDLSMQCLFNVIVDFAFSLVPIVGDIVSVAYKPNCRNAMLIEEFVNNKYRRGNNIKTGEIKMGTPLTAAKQS